MRDGTAANHLAQCCGCVSHPKHNRRGDSKRNENARDPNHDDFRVKHVLESHFSVQLREFEVVIVWLPFTRLAEIWYVPTGAPLAKETDTVPLEVPCGAKAATPANSGLTEIWESAGVTTISTPHP